METPINSVNENRTPRSRRFSATMALSLFLASSNLTTAALANDQGGRGAVWSQFKLDNQGLHGKELNEAFKDHWQDVSGIGVNSAGNAAAAINNAVNNAIPTSAAAIAPRLHMNDFASKAEFNSYKEALKDNTLKNLNQSLQNTGGNQFVKAGGGFSLDLSSAIDSITLGNNLFKEQSSVTISVGGQEKVLGAGAKVTAAEYVAAKQALAGSSQSVTLDAEGRATGGSVDLSALTPGNSSMKLDDLVVPVSVTASGDFSKQGDVRIKGDLINSGSINAYASDNKAVNAIISASNLTNNEGASIESTVSDLTLQADKNFANYGNISATGNLTISGEKSLTNSGTITAQQNLNIQSPKVFNTGTIASTNANVNLNAPIASEMNINNYNGTISALNGAINVRSADYAAALDSNIVGGDLFSREVNAYTGQGTTNIYVNELTGVVNTNGSAAHISANTENLILGNQCLVDDPTYFNTGNIVLGGDIIVGENLAIIAGGDITTTNTFLTIRAQNGNDGCDINMIAGANVTGTGSQTPNPLPDQSTVSGNALTASFSGASATGGNIDLTGSVSGGEISANGIGSGKAGNITLAAFSAAGAKGQILLNLFSNITAVGSPNGSINVIAGATSGQAIQLPTVINQGNGAAADILIVNAQPILSSGTTMGFDASGNITTGNTLVPSSTLNNAAIFTRTLTSTGNVTVKSGGIVKTNTINVSSTTPGVNAGNVLVQGSAVELVDIDASGLDGGNAGNVEIYSNSGTPFHSGTTFGTNKVGTVDISVSGAGNAGSLKIVNTGGGIFADALPLRSVTDGDGAHLTIEASDFINLQGFGSNIDLNAAGTNHNGGSFRMVYFDTLILDGSQPMTIQALNTGFGAGGSIHIESTSQNSAAAGVSMTVGSAAGQYANLLTGPTGSLTLDSGWNITVNNPGTNISAGTINLNYARALTLSKNLTATDISIKGFSTLLPAPFPTAVINGNLTANNNLSIDARTVTLNGVALNANTIQIARSGDPLTLNATSASTISAPGGILVSGSQVSLGGIITYNGKTLVQAQSVTVNSGTQNALTQSYFFAQNISGLSGNLAGSWTVFNQGALVSPFPQPSNLTISGTLGLANIGIISTGNIILDDATLVTSGGTITLLAGFDYTIAGPSYFPDMNLVLGGPVNNISANATGGSILGGGNLTTVNVTPGGTGGAVIAVANKGIVNLGSISTASSAVSGNGGAVTIIGENGVHVGVITTANAAGNAGAVKVFVGTANISAGASFTSGAFSGTVTPGTKTAGNLSVGGLNFGSVMGDVQITGALNAVDTISVAGLIGNNALTLTTGLGTTNIINSALNVVQPASSGGGTVNISSSSGVIFNTNVTSWDLNVATPIGGIAFNGGTFNSINATSSTGISFANVGGDPSVTGNATLRANGGNVTGKLNSGAGTFIDITASGDIGADALNRFFTNASSISTSSGGTTFLTSNNAGAVTLNGAQAGATYDFRANGTSVVTANGVVIKADIIRLDSGLADFGSASNHLQLGKDIGTTQLRVTSILGSAFIDYVGGGTLHLVGSQGDDFTLVSTDLVNGQVSLEGNSVFNGNVDITTSKIEMIDSLTAGGSINIHNDIGGLSVTGFAMILDAANETTLRGFNTLDVQGSISFTGSSAHLYGPNEVNLASGTTLNASTTSYIHTVAFDNQGNALQGGPWILLSDGTIANNPGNVTLTGVQNFTNLAIIAEGNIDITGATFNLTNPNGDGANLTMIAGYSFAPPTSGQVIDGTTIFHTFIPSGTGSIIGGATINANGTGNGGSVLAVASGSIDLGAINTSGSSGFGGDVTIIGNGNITLTTINSTGTTVDGDVSIQTGSATIPANFQIQTGSILPGASPINVDHSNHAITVDSINADVGSVEMKTGEGAGGSIAVSTSLSARNYDLQSQAINLGFTTLTSNRQSGAAGVVKVRTGTISGTVQPLTIDASGDVGGAGGEIDLTLLSGNPIILGQTDNLKLNVGASGGAAGKVSITSAGDLRLNTAAVSGAGTTGAGQLTVSTTGNLTIEDDAFNLAATNAGGAKISLTAGSDGTGELTLNDTDFFTQADATGANSDGGLLLLAGQFIDTRLSSAVDPLALTAKGNGTGDGGTIVFKTQDTLATHVGALAKAPKPPVRFLTALATGGGDAGSITIETGGSLSVNSVALLNASSSGAAGGNLKGASYTLKAGSVIPGTLIINGGLNANGIASGDAGIINLQSRSTTAFAVNPTKAPKNGMFGALSAIGNNGEINVTNITGGIISGAANSITAPTVRLTAGGTGTILSGGIINASNRLELRSNTGAIGGKTPLLVSTANLMAESNGIVGINNTFNAGTVTLEDSSGAKGFTLRTAATTNVNDVYVGIAGSILITTSAGDLVIGENQALTANNGALTLQNTNVATGRIILSDDSVVQTLGKGKMVSIVIGALVPKVGTFPFPANPAPSGVTATNTIKNVIFFDTPGVVVSTNAGGPAGDNARVEAKNINVLFDGVNAGSIILGKESFVFADPPAPGGSVNRINAIDAGVAVATRAVETSTNNQSQLFGFSGENATFTSDLSVNNLNTQQSQTANNAALLTATTHGFMTSGARELSLVTASITQQAYDGKAKSIQNGVEDDSYAVSYQQSGGEADGAICSDAILLSEQTGAAQVHNLEHRERVSITNGTVLYVPFKDTTVETPNGIVHIAAKAIALVSSSDAGLAVYDLEDQHKGSVSVESNGHQVVLSPGRHVTITPHHTAEFAQINSIETIAHRNVSSVVKNGMRAHTTEFSVMSAMDTVKPLKAMTMSKNAQAKHVADRLMKTTAIMMHLSGAGGGQYQYFFKPRLTASAGK